jgi:hypothetical protein
VDWLLVFFIVFLAIFTQSLTGFGLALVSMPLLSAVLGVQTAAPLVAIFALIAELVLLIYYRGALNLRVVWQLAIASIVGVPIGVVLLGAISEEVVLVILGLVVGGYALYALLNLHLPAWCWFISWDFGRCLQYLWAAGYRIWRLSPLAAGRIQRQFTRLLRFDEYRHSRITLAVWKCDLICLTGSPGCLARPGSGDLARHRPEQSIEPDHLSKNCAMDVACNRIVVDH